MKLELKSTAEIEAFLTDFRKSDYLKHSSRCVTVILKMLIMLLLGNRRKEQKHFDLADNVIQGEFDMATGARGSKVAVGFKWVGRVT